jgi:DNA-binding XRE family transcriptional regulator
MSDNTEGTVSQRIKILYEHFGNGNLSAFARQIGVTAQTIRDLMKGEKGGPSWPVVQHILQAFPSVSTDWLVLGEGEMLKLEKELKNSSLHYDPKNGVMVPRDRSGNLVLIEEPEIGLNPQMLERIKSIASTGGHQSVSPYPADQNNVQAVGLLSDIPIIELGRVSFKARASFNYAQLQRFMNSELFDKVLFRLPPGRTAEDYQDALVFDIEGDSMEPSLRDGQQVIAWPVPEGKWEYLHNTICVVDYDDTVAVKAVFKNELFDRDGLTLHATGGAGGSFTVARKDIHSIWEVREFYGVVPVRLFI